MLYSCYVSRSLCLPTHFPDKTTFRTCACLLYSLHPALRANEGVYSLAPAILCLLSPWHQTLLLKLQICNFNDFIDA